MIGIFDSGVGGLTVLREYLKKHPEYDYIYLGDQANVPYGNKSSEVVNKLVVQYVDFLAKKGCNLIIIACNTASADALRHVQEIYKGKPTILGVLVPAAEEALRQTRLGNIGVIGTRGTVKSGAYIREINKYAPTWYKEKDKRAHKEVKIIQQACPLLVPFIEEGLIKHVAMRMMLRKYLRPLKHAHVDSLILGCTHYELIRKEVERMMGKQCKIISSSQVSTPSIEGYFKRHPDVEASLSRGGTRTFYTTDCVERFEELGGKFLGQKIKAEKI